MRGERRGSTPGNNRKARRAPARTAPPLCCSPCPTTLCSPRLRFWMGLSVAATRRVATFSTPAIAPTLQWVYSDEGKAGDGRGLALQQLAAGPGLPLLTHRRHADAWQQQHSGPSRHSARCRTSRRPCPGSRARPSGRRRRPWQSQSPGRRGSPGPCPRCGREQRRQGRGTSGREGRRRRPAGRPCTGPRPRQLLWQPSQAQVSCRTDLTLQ